MVVKWTPKGRTSLQPPPTVPNKKTRLHLPATVVHQAVFCAGTHSFLLSCPTVCSFIHFLEFPGALENQEEMALLPSGMTVLVGKCCLTLQGEGASFQSLEARKFSLRLACAYTVTKCACTEDSLMNNSYSQVQPCFPIGYSGRRLQESPAFGGLHNNHSLDTS